MAVKFTYTGGSSMPSWAYSNPAYSAQPPRIFTGTVHGRTGNFMQWQVNDGEQRCECLASPTSTYSASYRTMKTRVEEFCLAPGFPLNPSGGSGWLLIQQEKDHGSQSTSPPMSLHIGDSKGLHFRGVGMRGNPSFSKTIISTADLKTGVWYGLATEIFLDGPSAGSVRALVCTMADPIWREAVPRTTTGTWYMDGGQSESRYQMGVYHHVDVGAAKRWAAYVAGGNGTLQSDYGIVVGGSYAPFGGTGGGGGGTPPPPPPTGGFTAPPVDANNTTIRANMFSRIESQVLRTDTSISPPAYPHFTVGSAGTWSTVNEDHWTAGFFPGILWDLYDRTGVTDWRDRAITWQTTIGTSIPNKHDVGMMFYNAFVKGYRLTQDETMRTKAFDAATVLNGRWDADVGAFRSQDAGFKDWGYNTIIDSVMNMELLLWCAANGHTSATELRSRAITHLLTVRTQHLRSDGSTHQVVEYNDTTGAVTRRFTDQGISDTSTWARGQAWAIYGFTAAYRYLRIIDPTNAALMLDAAKRAANYFLDTLPNAPDVAYYDFAAPVSAPRDSSACAIAASALVELGTFDTTRAWRAEGINLLGWLGNTDFMQAATTTGPYSTLLHGTSNFNSSTGVDAGLIYGDHYFNEALMRVSAVPTPDPDPDPDPDPTPVLDPLKTLDETFDGTGPLFGNRTSDGVTVSGGQLRLTITADIHSAEAGTQPKWDVREDGVVIGPITWPTWISGSGEVLAQLRLDFGNDNRIVIRRKTTRDSASGNADKITADTVECRLVVATEDTSPIDVNWSALPVGVQYLKLGIMSGGLGSYQASADGTSFTPVTTTPRTIPAAIDLTLGAGVEIELRRSSGDVVVTTMSVGRAFGVDDPGPGSAPTPGTSVLTFSNHARVFPEPTSDPTAFLVVMRPGTASRDQVPVSHAKASGAPWDTFNRADAASIDTSAPGTGWGSAGDDVIPAIVSNQAKGSTTASARYGALIDTAMSGSDHGAWMKLGLKQANPAAKLFNWHNVLLRVNALGNTGQGYALIIALDVDGTTDWRWGLFTGGDPQASFVTLATGVPLASGDSFGGRIVGSTLQAFRKPAAGQWIQVGTNQTNTTYTTGTRVGFTMRTTTTSLPGAIDDFNYAAFSTSTEPFPLDHSGRSMYLTSGRQPQWRENTITPSQAFGSGTYDSSQYVAVLVGRDPSDSQVSTRLWDVDANVIDHNENIATVSAGVAITGGQLVIGDREWGDSTDASFDGQIALVAGFSDEPESVGFESFIQSGGIISKAAVAAHPAAIFAYSMVDMANATDTIEDLVGSADEDTTKRLGTGTLFSDPGNVPIGEGTVPTPPSPIASVPQPPRPVATGAMIDPADTTPPFTGKVTITTVVPVANGSISFTPHATPISLWQSLNGGATRTQVGSWQSSATFNLTGLTLDPGDGSQSRLYYIRYRNNEGTPRIGDFSEPVGVTILENVEEEEVTPVDTLSVVRTTGQMVASWDVPPATEGVTLFRLWYTPFTQVIDYNLAPHWEGAGSVAGGRVTAPAITGLTDTTRYRVGVRAARLV